MIELEPNYKRKIGGALFAVFILLAVFLGVKSISALKEYTYIGRGEYPANVITVTGTGEVYAKPDIGSFTFSVVEEAKTVALAQDAASKKMNAILDALKKMGIAENDIKTDNYSSYPKYDYGRGEICTATYCPQTKPTLIGYEVTQGVSVKVRKTDIAGDVLTKVGGLGAQNISSLQFVVDDSDKVQAEARDKAIADAKAKAKVLSKSLGVRLSKIVNFYESGGPIFYSMKAEGLGGGVSADVTPTPPQLPTGENKITSTVTITYEVD